MADLDPTRTPMESLAAFGPRGGSASPADARAYAVAFARRASENFVVLGRLLPRELVEDFAAVYAFCRWADDLGDEPDPALGRSPEPQAVRDRAHELLAWFRGELERDQPTHPVLVALAPTIERHRLPKAEFGKLLAAFEMDQRVRCYESWDELLAYCALSANPVGRVVLMMAGLRPPEEDPSSAGAWRRSDAICTALQITNHVQDVRRDLLERERVYLPADETGFGIAELRSWAHTPELAGARVRYIRGVRPLIERTKTLYDEGSDLPALIGGRLGSLVGMITMGGRATLRRIEREGCVTLWKRPRVGALGRGAIAVRGLASLYYFPWRGNGTNSNASSR